MTTIMWFREDLRLTDNPALSHACRNGPAVPAYIFDDAAGRPLGGASRWWLHHSLEALDGDLGGGLVVLHGAPAACLARLVAATGADRVVWNRRYDGDGVAADTAIKTALKGDGVAVESFSGSLLCEPWEVTTKDGGPFKVYSPFWRALQGRGVAAALGRPEIEVADADVDGAVSIGDLGLLPTRPNWAAGWEDLWRPGEAGAAAAWQAFVDDGLDGYGTLRDRPDKANVSRLSPHLRFGEISPRQLWAAIEGVAEDAPGLARDGRKFLSELGWREFSYHLLFHFPALATENWRGAFDAYPWRDSATDLAAWQRGLTGYPLVDAGMRELWQTGYMHNRVRMVAASFLIKHLRLDWRHGEAWFWDTLVDADPANNAASWQWVAGSGADAAPYFRIFNPTTQGRKFDPDGAYVRRWCPELADLPDAKVHAPFEATPEELDGAGIVLGETYPAPMVDHKAARAAALDGYEAVKNANA